MRSYSAVGVCTDISSLSNVSIWLGAMCFFMRTVVALASVKLMPDFGFTSFSSFIYWVEAWLAISLVAMTFTIGGLSSIDFCWETTAAWTWKGYGIYTLLTMNFLSKFLISSETPWVKVMRTKSLPLPLLAALFSEFFAELI